MADMVARKRFRYANRALVPGEDFVAKASHARILKALGRAEDKIVFAVPRRRRSRRKDDAGKTPGGEV